MLNSDSGYTAQGANGQATDTGSGKIPDTAQTAQKGVKEQKFAEPATISQKGVKAQGPAELANQKENKLRSGGLIKKNSFKKAVQSDAQNAEFARERRLNEKVTDISKKPPAETPAGNTALKPAEKLPGMREREKLEAAVAAVLFDKPGGGKMTPGTQDGAGGTPYANSSMNDYGAGLNEVLGGLSAQIGIERELREISALDPSVNSFQDLAKIPEYDRLLSLVEKGNSLTDAYKLSKFDELTKRHTAVAKQAALNSVASRAHMRPTKMRGPGGAVVPSEVAMQYRKLIPGISDLEIQKHYESCCYNPVN